MNENVEFLNYIYQNAEMGVKGIAQIIERVDNASLRNLMEEQKVEYEAIMNKASEIYKKYGKDEQELSTLTKVSSTIMTEMMMLTKHEDNKIAKMMIEGSNKGIIEITEKLNHFKNSDEEIKTLAEKLLATEQHNLDELKKYL